MSPRTRSELRIGYCNANRPIASIAPDRVTYGNLLLCFASDVHPQANVSVEAG